MCLRPDIIYVVTQPVWDDFVALRDIWLWPDSGGFFDACEAHCARAREASDQDAERHWLMVQELAVRYGCSPLSGVEIDGKSFWEDPKPGFRPEHYTLIRLVIGDPDNPPHEHGQWNIVPEMRQT